ncbi:MAG: hypothetical protein HY850_04945 [Betaproteobacteria bacterium]|nr:hypothetical protein [Betaproteobacteria bacterium]
MGYDYFVSEAVKNKLNAIANDFVGTYKNQLDIEIAEKASIFKAWLPRLLTGAFYALACVVIYIAIQLLLKSFASPLLLLPSLILLIGFAIFGIRASNHLSAAFSYALIPLTTKVIAKLLISFLLYSSKGSIAALGMVSLIAAFACRYINAYHL